MINLYNNKVVRSKFGRIVSFGLTSILSVVDIINEVHEMESYYWSSVPAYDIEKMNEPDHPYAEFDWITTEDALASDLIGLRRVVSVAIGM